MLHLQILMLFREMLEQAAMEFHYKGRVWSAGKRLIWLFSLLSGGRSSASRHCSITEWTKCLIWTVLPLCIFAFLINTALLLIGTNTFNEVYAYAHTQTRTVSLALLSVLSGSVAGGVFTWSHHAVGNHCKVAEVNHQLPLQSSTCRDESKYLLLL